MTSLEIIFHVIELLAAVSLLYIVVFAIKKFKLIIWKKGWYLIGLGGFLIILKELTALFFHGIETPIHNLIHSFDTISLVCIIIGIIILSKSIEKILGK